VCLIDQEFFRRRNADVDCRSRICRYTLRCRIDCWLASGGDRHEPVLRTPPADKIAATCPAEVAAPQEGESVEMDSATRGMLAELARLQAPRAR